MTGANSQGLRTGLTLPGGRRADGHIDGDPSSCPRERRLPAARRAEATSDTYTAGVLPILKNRCLGCHNGTAKMGGLVMDSYESLRKGGAHGAIVDLREKAATASWS